jgi:hypothetical protein
MNGQDIIADIETDQHGITAKSAAAIHLVPSQNNDGRFGIALLPFVPFADGNKVTIKTDKVMIEYEPSIELRNNYNRMFGSGIEIANVMPGK